MEITVFEVIMMLLTAMSICISSVIGIIMLVVTIIATRNRDRDKK